MIKIDLQHFAKEADEEEIDDIEEEEDVEESEESEEEDTEKESEESEQEESEEIEEPEKETKKPNKDKVTKAIIREKQENKKLRDRLTALEKEKLDREQAEKDSKYRQKLIDDGFSENEADDRVAEKRRNDRLEREIRELKYGHQADKLATKYPDIYDHLDSFISVVEASKGSLTLAELCKAKLDETTTHEIKTKTEQEMLLQKQKSKSKQIKEGENKTPVTIKFSPEDEEAYKFYVAKNPGKTRKDYNEILKVKRGE
jgi:hypothetical protein